jgi:membrane fusion protein (multidrug efflux system)
MKKFFAFLVFAGVAGLLIWLVWLRPVATPREDEKPEAVAAVHVAKISRATLKSYVVGYGNIEAAPTAQTRLATSVPGVVSAIRCVEGQKVEKDALLFELDSRAATIAVSFAERNFERQKKLAQAESTSQKVLQESEQQLAAARAQLALLQIRAPFSGTIAKINVKTGEAADLTTPLAELIDLEHLVIAGGLPSAELTGIKTGQPIEIFQDGTTNVLSSSVSFVSPQVDAKNDTGIIRADLPGSSGVRFGQFVKFRIVTGERKNVLTVPIASVAKDPSGAVFVALIENDKAVLKPAQTGIREGDLIEVEGEGIEADKSVVTEGAYGLIATQQFATKVQIVND